MRRSAVAAACVALAAALTGPAARAGPLEGTVKLGGIFLDETGDLSAVQETYDVQEGFNVAQLRLSGLLAPGRYLALDLRDLTLASRRGDVLFRVPGMLKLTAGYDQHRQVFSPDRGVRSERRDWRAGADYTPVPWLGLSGSFNHLARDGDRLAFPPGTESALGTRYDNTLNSGQLTAEVREGRRGGALSYQVSRFSDALAGGIDRTGQVVSARLYTPCAFYDRLTHLVRAAYGVHVTGDGGPRTTLVDFQYTGILEPRGPFQLRYEFAADRVDDEAARLKTDRFCNTVSATYLYPRGQVRAGYGYETNDDDRTLTSYQSWQAGASYRAGRLFSAKVDYAGRVKDDQEDLTLLKDLETWQLRAKAQLQPVEEVVVGGELGRRRRTFPDIGVSTDGRVAGAFARWTRAGWGAVSADYSFTTDAFADPAGGFDARSQVVTGRVDVERIKVLRLAGGLTYLDIKGDLDIEKSMVFLEGAWTMVPDYRLEVRYNVYNYDDYVLLSRYYTANVVRVELARDLHLK